MVTLEKSDAATTLERWLQSFEQAVESSGRAALQMLFVSDSYWRDVLAFGWEYKTFAGREEIIAALVGALADVRPHSFCLSTTRLQPRSVKRLGRQCVEGFFEFKTHVGDVHAFVRLLVEGQEEPRAWVFLTALQSIYGFEEKIGARRPTGEEYSRRFAGDNWLEQREKERAYADHDPEVLIVGAGQCGLALAARLRQMGTDTLVIEKFDRVGDNWRTRYHSLTLHNEVWSNHLPYMPFPPNWPIFLPKDKVAGWLEGYAEFMEINVWTGTEFIGASYDDAAGIWTVRLKKANCAERLMRVPHLVLAIGSAAGAPSRPPMPGLEQFKGRAVHSSEFTRGSDYADQCAIVVGTGVSGHDVAQELYENGAKSVTIVQRSSTTVLSLIPSGTLVYGIYKEDPVDDADLISLATPVPLLIEGSKRLTKHTSELDKDLLAKLKAVGFEADLGDYEAGFYLKYLNRAGGYYINVGCSDLIAEEKVHLVQWSDIDTFVADGLRTKDGEIIPADIVIQATGYENQQHAVARLLGKDVGGKIGPIWGFDEYGFMRNMWQRTAQTGLWIMGGSLIEARLYSRYLAVLIRASLEGLIPGGEKRRPAQAKNNAA